MRGIALWILLGCTATAAARDRYVDPVRGDDRNDGFAAVPDGRGHGPVRSIHYGVRFAQPGDTVHLAPTGEPYRESVVLHDRLCPADRPITVDGHGAVITGADPIALTEWERVAPGRYRKVDLLRTDAAVIGRFFFRFNGAVQHMGRTSKGPSAALKRPDDLLPGEWTFVETERAFYVQIDPATSPSDARIEAPLRSSGVQVSGRNENLTIKNLHVRHVYNDGFNIHGYCLKFAFVNVSAGVRGHDGMSALNASRIVVRGLTSIGNSTGFCHTNDSHSDSDGVYIRDCLGFDVFVLDGGRHRLSNSLVLSSAVQGLVVVGPQRTAGNESNPKRCTLELENVALVRRGRYRTAKFQAGSIVRAFRCTFDDFDLAAAGDSLELRRSIVAGPERKFHLGPNVKFAAEGNLYDVAEVVVGDRRLTRGSADAALGPKARWAEVRFRADPPGTVESPAAPDVGVRPERLPSSLVPDDR